MREPLRYALTRTREELDDLSLFAASFDHKVDDHTIHPLVRVFRGQQLIAYFTVVRAPVMFPSFHPAHCSHRDFLEICQQVRAWACLDSISDQFPNGQCWLAVDKVPAVPLERIKKLGFEPTNSELFHFK